MTSRTRGRNTAAATVTWTQQASSYAETWTEQGERNGAGVRDTDVAHGRLPPATFTR
jgi:hypothetical protein